MSVRHTVLAEHIDRDAGAWPLILTPSEIAVLAGFVFRVQPACIAGSCVDLGQPRTER
ncbi:MAG: hypothetical protein KDB80_08715 [Planctomycetes bacterium]|nr:hypothetical protein [Planctomycetota bacterium]